MKLETETGTNRDNPTDEEIEMALKELVKSGGGFAILSQSEQVFIQTAENGMDECTLEYREGSEDRHFCCKNEELEIRDVIRAFQDYANENSSWKTRFEWRPLYMDPDAEPQPVDSVSTSATTSTPNTSGKSGCLGVVLLGIITISFLVCQAI